MPLFGANMAPRPLPRPQNATKSKRRSVLNALRLSKDLLAKPEPPMAQRGSAVLSPLHRAMPSRGENNPFTEPNAPSPEFYAAMKLLDLESVTELEEQFLKKDAFLVPWIDFRDSFLLLQTGDMPRMSLPGRVTRESILWWYNQYDEGKYRYDPCDEDADDDSVHNGQPGIKRSGAVDRTTWGVDEYEKHLYVWLLQNFKVGKSRNDFEYFRCRNICTAWEAVFVPIITTIVNQYDIRGRRFYNRIALYIENARPSGLAFPENNVTIGFSHVRNSEDIEQIRERRKTRAALNGKEWTDEQKELRKGFEKWGGVVEKPVTDFKAWINNQRVIAHRNKARWALEGGQDAPLKTAGLGPDLEGEYDLMRAQAEPQTASTVPELITPPIPPKSPMRQPSNARLPSYTFPKRGSSLSHPIPPALVASEVGEIVEAGKQGPELHREYSNSSSVYEGEGLRSSRSITPTNNNITEFGEVSPELLERHPSLMHRPVSKANIRAVLDQPDSDDSDPELSPYGHKRTPSAPASPVNATAAAKLKASASQANIAVSPPTSSKASPFTLRTPASTSELSQLEKAMAHKRKNTPPALNLSQSNFAAFNSNLPSVQETTDAHTMKAAVPLTNDHHAAPDVNGQPHANQNLTTHENATRQHTIPRRPPYAGRVPPKPLNDRALLPSYSQIPLARQRVEAWRSELVPETEASGSTGRHGANIPNVPGQAPKPASPYMAPYWSPYMANANGSTSAVNTTPTSAPAPVNPLSGIPLPIRTHNNVTTTVARAQSGTANGSAPRRGLDTSGESATSRIHRGNGGGLNAQRNPSANAPRDNEGEQYEMNFF